MLGQDVTYDWVPYFFSDQYDLGMEAAGLPEPGTYDEVVYRGDKDSLEFISFWLADRVVVAGMNVNVWDVNDDIQALIRSGANGRPRPPGRPRHPPHRPLTARPVRLVWLEWRPLCCRNQRETSQCYALEFVPAEATGTLQHGPQQLGTPFRPRCRRTSQISPALWRAAVTKIKVWTDQTGCREQQIRAAVAEIGAGR